MPVLERVDARGRRAIGGASTESGQSSIGGPLDLPRLVVNDLSRIRRRRIRGMARHAMLMTDSRAQYEREMRTSRADPLNRYV